MERVGAYMEYKAKLKFCAVVPAFCEEKKIAGVVTSIRQYCPNVIVIDDGSTDNTAAEAEKAKAAAAPATAPAVEATPAPAAQAAPAAPAKHGHGEDEAPAEIEYDDFAKVDLRLAKVIACEEIKKSKKLLKLTLEVGAETRTVVSGIKQWYTPDDLVGKTVVLVANLKPVTLCGVESHGMILCASDAADENLSALTTLAAMESGLKVR